MKFIKVLFVAAFLAPAMSFACIIDHDCAIGSKCVKSPGASYGICAGGFNPGNANDKSPVSADRSRDPMNTYGNTCSIDPDCGPDQKCLKEGGQREGVCVKRR